MRKRAASPPSSASAGSAPGAPPLPSAHRPVISLALALSLPALWLLLNGNVSVQTALVRFIGALLVSWVAASLVITTARNSTRSTPLRATAPRPEPLSPAADPQGEPSGG